MWNFLKKLDPNTNDLITSNTSDDNNENNQKELDYDNRIYYFHNKSNQDFLKTDFNNNNDDEEILVRKNRFRPRTSPSSIASYSSSSNLKHNKSKTFGPKFYSTGNIHSDCNDTGALKIITQENSENDGVDGDNEFRLKFIDHKYPFKFNNIQQGLYALKSEALLNQ